MKRTIIFLLLCLLLALVGCELLNPDGTPVTRATKPATRDWDGLELGAELRRALDAESNELIWSVPEEPRPEGTASVCSYTALDCEALWVELKQALFPEASLRAQIEKDGMPALELEDAGQTFTLQKSDSFLYFDGLSPERGRAVLDGLRDFLERERGLSLRLWTAPAPEEQEIVYGVTANGLPVEARTDSPLTVSCLFQKPEGGVVLLNPILPGEVPETADPENLMTAEQLRSAAESGWHGLLPMAAELTDCALVLYIDDEQGTLRPAWSLTGTGYAFDTGKMIPVELLFDALTGEQKRLR